jgi:hypothetical protein
MPRALHMTSRVSATTLTTSVARGFDVFMNKVFGRKWAFSHVALPRVPKKKRLQMNGRGAVNLK